MSTNLDQFDLTWNLANNSKSVENQKKVAITKVVPNYTFFLHKFPGIFFHRITIFPEENSVFDI
jgi:hypothetical protein